MSAVPSAGDDAGALERILVGRRMCRDFEPTEVPEGTAERLVDAATRAPSAGNTAALDIVALEGDRTAVYWDLTLPVGRRAKFAWPGLLAAPLLLVPYVDPAAYVSRYGESDKERTGLGSGEDAWPVPYWFVDGGAAVMAMLLAAEALGLGALFFGQFGHEAAVSGALGVPDGHRALGTLAVGVARDGGRHRSGSAQRGRPDPAAVLRRGRWSSAPPN